MTQDPSVAASGESTTGRASFVRPSGQQTPSAATNTAKTIRTNMATRRRIVTDHKVTTDCDSNFAGDSTAALAS
jgi:hypothetical protein